MHTLRYDIQQRFLRKENPPIFTVTLLQSIALGGVFRIVDFSSSMFFKEELLSLRTDSENLYSQARLP